MSPVPNANGRQERGFVSILSNPHFVRLWVAQTLGLAAQNGIHFVQMVVIEHLTGSSTHMGLMILAFSLPGVLFSAVAGVVVDRLSKKTVLMIGTILRVIIIAGYVLALRALTGWHVLVALYGVTFVVSSVAQFFAPAMWAKVPLIIGEDKLLAANALFNLTYAIAQAVGIIVLAPLSVKLIGIEATFIAIAGIYAIVGILIAALPGDRPLLRRATGTQPALGRAWQELREGWTFVTSQRGIYMPMGQLTLIATLLMVLAMLAPGFSARVLGMAAEDAVYIFAPAGVGMLLATFCLGRFGRLLRRETWINLSLLGCACGFGALGVVSRGQMTLRIPLLEAYPEAAISMTSAIMGIALLTGFFMAMVNTVAQTALQERSPAEIRGRVYAVQFLLANLVGIPPLLGFGGLADILGIPVVCFVLAGLLAVVWLLSMVGAAKLHRAEERCAHTAEITADGQAGRPRILVLAPSPPPAARHWLALLTDRLRAWDGPELRLATLSRHELIPRWLRPALALLTLWQSAWPRMRRHRPSSDRPDEGPRAGAEPKYLRWLSHAVRAAVEHPLLCYQPGLIICADAALAPWVAEVCRRRHPPCPLVVMLDEETPLPPSPPLTGVWHLRGPSAPRGTAWRLWSARRPAEDTPPDLPLDEIIHHLLDISRQNSTPPPDHAHAISNPDPPMVQ